MRAPRRCAVTLIEVLVVISIIGMLMSLLLPAVQSAREAGRRTTCQNHLHQLGVAMLNHETAYRRFPSGGWGFAWAGDPDRGTGRNQPGGWVYDLLPYLERGDLARLGSGQPFNQKKDDLTLLVQMPLAMFNCPTRRPLTLVPFAPSPPPINFHLVAQGAQTDYAVNAGDYDFGGGPGPNSLADGDDPSYSWKDTSKATGICYLRSEITPGHVKDGLSHTYLIGEKYTNHGGTDPGDDQTMYAGYDYDAYRWTKPGSRPLCDARASAPDTFGSAHPTGCSFIFCDGSVRLVRYEIDATLHQRLGNRADGKIIDDAGL
jgi:prepilin-type N-terminal cleavage/methylation domain-containing protein